MTFKEIMNIQLEEKKYFDMVGAKYLSNVDVDVCNYVVSQLAPMDVSSIKLGDSISFKTLLEMSLQNMMIFGYDVYLDISRFMHTININCVDGEDIFKFGTVVRYNVDFNNRIVPSSGEVAYYVMPRKIYELSVCFLSHEHVHALKDTNYMEYIENKTVGETIPIFLELICCESNEQLKKWLMQYRIKCLLDNKVEYMFFDDMLRQNNDNTCLWEYVRSKVGGYLNSFYYAIILYNIYKQNAKVILDLVSKVLKQEMTTPQLLMSLGVYGEIKESIFEKELGSIRKLVR